MNITTRENCKLTLVGSQCKECSTYFFPVRSKCSNCYSENVEEIKLSNKGTIYSYTIVRTRSPINFSMPYAVGYVLLDYEQIAVPALFHFSKEQLDFIHIGQKVEYGENEVLNVADFVFVPID